MRIIVGSTALKEFSYCPNVRLKGDLDIWVSTKEEIVPNTDCKVIPEEILKLIPTVHRIAKPNAIYTIKCSHAMYDIHWDKTISDIIYLRHKGCVLIPELHHILCNYWKKVHGNKDFLNLNRSKEEFFNDYVKKEYDHDLLHEIVANYDDKIRHPIYTEILKDGQEVLLDKSKFNKLSFETQIRLFREEIWVIALERWLIPSNFKIPKYKAYRYALRKTVTKLTKGWATNFILDNIEEYVKMGGTTWYNNFLKHIGKEYKMHPIIQKLQDKANEHNVDVESALFHGDDSGDVDFDNLLKEMGYKLIEQEGGEDQGSSAHSVIELEGQLFRSDYSYASYDGYYIDDCWDWTPVNAVKKEVTVYE